MEIGEFIAFALNGLTQIVRHVRIGVHIQQDRTSVADQPVRPTRDDTSTHDTREGVHPEPAKGPGEQQADDHAQRYSGVGNHVDHGGAHVVVTFGCPMRVLVFLEDDRIVLLTEPHMRGECVRLRDLAPIPGSHPVPSS
jgi:hypothetical protein